MIKKIITFTFGKIYTSLFFVILFLIVDYFHTRFLISSKLSFFLVSVLEILIIFFLILNIIYKLLFNFNQKLKSLFFILFSLLISLFIQFRFIAITEFWMYSVNIQKGATKNLWKFDYKLAHKLNKNTTGSYFYHINNKETIKIKVLTDSIGFRGLEKNHYIKSDTMNLFLGCSYTFGDYIRSEEGFPYKTSKLLNQNFLNAGGSAYGLGQMKDLFDNLTKKYKFNFVFIQLSPWLVSRAIDLNGPTFYGYRPFPYFSDYRNTFRLNNPAYTVCQNFNKNDFWRNKNTYLDKLHFLITTGFNVEIKDYFNFKITTLKVFLGLIPSPTKKRNELEIYFYDYIIKKCKKLNLKPVVLKLSLKDENYNRKLLNLISQNALLIDLDKAEIENYKTKNSEKNKIYYLDKKGVKIFYDNHPNEIVNTIYSEYIYNKILENFQKSKVK